VNDPVRIDLEPLGRRIEVERGAPLQDALFAYGVEFPCGGRGRCNRCRVKVLNAGADADWRLACEMRAESDLTLEVAQWDAAILADNSSFEFTPQEGRGIAVDLGTTTVVAQWVDLSSGQVLDVRTALNPQVAYGADIMTRVEFALNPDGQEKLHGLAQRAIAEMVRDWPASRMTVVGNTVMQHLFCGLDVTPLSHRPFEPEPRSLAPIPLDSITRFLPSLGGFVGSDILAGILATRMLESEHLTALIDLGTNGEIAIGGRERIVCASTAAGPAFEGGRISMGMRAATGAISEVDVKDGRLDCHVLGKGKARGICGSGLVDAVAAGLDLDLVAPNGRLISAPLRLAPPVALTQRDIRELQMAKAATAAGVEVLLRRLGARLEEIRTVYLAGAFGNYVNRASARRIGLIEFPLEAIEQAGNTALLGAKLALFRDFDYDQIRRRIEHVPLAEDPEFMETYVAKMAFPA
jgi:uncharacterized 2Fe-2S/4Fe-4S cluster protein (DUF4445 family)